MMYFKLLAYASTETRTRNTRLEVQYHNPLTIDAYITLIVFK